MRECSDVIMVVCHISCMSVVSVLCAKFIGIYVSLDFQILVGINRVHEQFSSCMWFTGTYRFLNGPALVNLGDISGCFWTHLVDVGQHSHLVNTWHTEYRLSGLALVVQLHEKTWKDVAKVTTHRANGTAHSTWNTHITNIAKHKPQTSIATDFF